MPRRSAEIDKDPATPPQSTAFLPAYSPDLQGERVSKICDWIKDTKGHSLSRLLPEVIEHVRSFTHADGAAIALRDEHGLLCRASIGNAPALGARLKPDSGLTQE